MRTVYYFKEDLNILTDIYYSIIIDALKQNGHKVVEIPVYSRKATKKISKKDDYLLITTLREFLLLYLRGYRNFIYWYQGIGPEENYMMMGKKWREIGYAWIEKLSLRKVRYKIAVSKYMFQHYERKYKIKLNSSECFIMPCFNSPLYKENFHIPGKYNQAVFCYAGGMSVWQGFHKILEIYKEIEDHYEGTFLRVYSTQLEKAKEFLEKYKIRNYSLAKVKREEMNNVLAQCKYGFLIREDHIVNNVATPTKLATYIGNGVIPIITDTIFAYADIAKEYPHVYCFGKDNKAEVIHKALTDKISADELEKEYTDLMNKYFNPQRYATLLREFFKGL